MSDIYITKPQTVHAMFWDGSNESYLRIAEWVKPFLVEDEEARCNYWDDYEAEPTQEEIASLLPGQWKGETVRKVDEWRYRTIQFYAWGDDVEVDPGSWIVFYGSERDLNAKSDNIKAGCTMSDEEFKEQFEEAS